MKTAALFAAALLTACTPVRPAAYNGTAALDGNWRISRLYTPLPADGQGVLSLNAAESRFSLNLGCNTLFGSFTQTAGSLTFGEAASTLKMCSEQAMERDRTAAQVLAQTRGYRRQGDMLQLTDADGRPVLTATAE